MKLFFRQNTDSDEKKFEKKLSALDCCLSSVAKKRMKSRLMAAISDNADLKEYAKLIAPMQVLAEEVETPREIKASMRRRLMNRISIDLGSFSFFDVFAKGVFSRATVAVMMIFMVSFVSIFTFQLNMPTAYAKDSVLRNPEGDVYVYRSGMLQPATDGFVLAEGDKIHTGYDSSVTAIFMDDTVSRVAGESKLHLSRMLRSEGVHDTEIILGVAEGRVWSRVSSLISGSFSVATLHTVAKASRNATFDVNVGLEDEVAISVVENFVDVELSSYVPAVQTTVAEGESLIVDNGRNMIVSLDDKDAWLRTNMSKDEFESQLLAQEGVSDLEESIGALPTDKLYGVKTFKENLGVVLSVNQREKLATQLAIADKRLAEAEILLNKGLAGNAEEVLREYKQIMLDITQEYDSLIGIADVEMELSAMIAKDKRKYYTTLPGSSLYEVREVVKEVEFLLQGDRVRANRIALNNASDDLYQVFDLLGHGAQAMAEISVSDYPTVLENTLRDLMVYDMPDKSAYARAIFVTSLSDLKTINALSDSFEDTDSMDISGVRDRVIAVLEEYFPVFNIDSSYDDLLAELEILQNHDLDELVELSEFVGVSDQNAATVDIAIINIEESVDSEL